METKVCLHSLSNCANTFACKLASLMRNPLQLCKGKRIEKRNSDQSSFAQSIANFLASEGGNSQPTRHFFVSSDVFATLTTAASYNYSPDKYYWLTTGFATVAAYNFVLLKPSATTYDACPVRLPY